MRRRGQKQVEDAKIYAVQGFCKDLLEVADNLERAVDALDANSLEKTPELKGLHEGISMTKLVLHKVFEKHGLKKVDPEGEKFDPNLHEALMEIPKAAVSTSSYLIVSRAILSEQVRTWSCWGCYEDRLFSSWSAYPSCSSRRC